MKNSFLMFRKMTHKAKMADYSNTPLAPYDLSVKMINLCMEFNTQHNFCFLLLLEYSPTNLPVF